MKTFEILSGVTRGTRLILDVSNLYWKNINGKLELESTKKDESWNSLRYLAGEFEEETDKFVKIYMLKEIFVPSSKGFLLFSVDKKIIIKIRKSTIKKKTSITTYELIKRICAN